MTIQWTPNGCGVAAMDLEETRASSPVPFPDDLVAAAGRVDLGIEQVYFAWELARMADGLSPEEQRALILLVLAAEITSIDGSTRLPLGDRERLVRVLEDLGASGEDREAIASIVKQARAKKRSAGGVHAVVGGASDYRPIVIDHDCVYIQKLHALESRVGMALRERIGEAGGAKLDKATEKALQEVIDSPPVESFGAVLLDEEQKDAVRAALSGRIAVVSGRPGSGKTSIVAGILRVLARLGDPPLEAMALAAPTGKAADRMRQSIAGQLSAVQDPSPVDVELAQACPPSMTLHRLLGYSPANDRFRHNEHNQLSERLIIVDESSMMDLSMMDRLLRALRPDARLILLGDADQLPSIEAGAVLRDLCRARAAIEARRVVVLQKSYRAREEDSSGKRILDVAAAINEKRSPAEAGGGKAMRIRTSALELEFAGVEHLMPGDGSQRREFFDKWWDRLFGSWEGLEDLLAASFDEATAGFDEETTSKLRSLSKHYERFRILCVTRLPAGGAGSEAVNGHFHARRLEELRRRGEIEGSPNFLMGEPVLVTRNDYSLGLYNGDSGLVLKVRPHSGGRRREAESMAVFPRADRFVAFPFEALRGRLEPAWATTVHKSQGSEYENVAVILPEAPVRPLTKELLYTAVTRAKKSVVIVGPGEVLRAGVERALDRASGLGDMLG